MSKPVSVPFLYQLGSSHNCSCGHETTQRHILVAMKQHNATFSIFVVRSTDTYQHQRSVHDLSSFCPKETYGYNSRSCGAPRISFLAPGSPIQLYCSFTASFCAPDPVPLTSLFIAPYCYVPAPGSPIQLYCSFTASFCAPDLTAHCPIVLCSSPWQPHTLLYCSLTASFCAPDLTAHCPIVLCSSPILYCTVP